MERYFLSYICMKVHTYLLSLLMTNLISSYLFIMNLAPREDVYGTYHTVILPYTI